MRLTLEQALEQLGNRPDRRTLEDYIAHAWVRPAATDPWHFEEIDLARVQLVHYLRQDIMAGDDAMDILLSLLDQLYGMREQMRRLSDAIKHQPKDVHETVRALLAKFPGIE